MRAAAVRDAKFGFLLACDPKLVRSGAAHAIAFLWKDGAFKSGRAKYSATDLCIVEHPEYGVVKISGGGTYSG